MTEIALYLALPPAVRENRHYFSIGMAMRAIKTTIFFSPIPLCVISLSFLLSACTATRSIIHSPQAVPKNEWRLGANMLANFPTQTATALYGGLEAGVDALYSQYAGGDTVRITADGLNGFAKALVAYSLDPLTAQSDLFVRYGIISRFDLGYRYSGGAHVFDGRYQFMGPAGVSAGAGSGEGAGGAGGNAWSGSIALQYCGQSFELPPTLGLDKLQKILKFEFTRKDFLVPIIFGKPLGRAGRFGDFALGLAYDLALVEYGSDLLKIVNDQTGAPFGNLNGKSSISAYGGFANMRLGYRRVFLLGSFALYYQDYGTFELFGGKSASLSGFTLLPSLGLEIRI